MNSAEPIEDPDASDEMTPVYDYWVAPPENWPKFDVLGYPVLFAGFETQSSCCALLY